MLLNEKTYDKYNGLFIKYHDKHLLNLEIPQTDLVVLCTFLLNEDQKKSKSKHSQVQDLFKELVSNAENFRKRMYEAKKKNLITVNEKDANEKVVEITIDGLRIVEKYIGEVQHRTVHIIKQGSSFSAIKLFEEFLSQEIRGTTLKIVDTYISSESLFPLSSLPITIKKVQILTKKVHDIEKIIDRKNKLEKEKNINVEIKSNKKLHDRYLLDSKEAWTLGTSINSLGKNDSTLTQVPELKEDLNALFDDRWSEGINIEQITQKSA